MPNKLTIREWRLMREIPQKDVAKYIGVGLNTFIRWEKHNEFITVDKAFKLAELFGCTLDDIKFVFKTT